MRAIIKQIRLPNLVIIAVTLYAFRYLVVKPYYRMSGTDFQMDTMSFGLMVAITMLIAVIGYLSNDYFDAGIDQINHPERVPINRKVKERTLITTAFLLSLVCVAGITILSIRLGSGLVAFVLLLALFTVWWYARILKRSFIWGNLAVSLMSSLTLGMAWFFEWIKLNSGGFHLYETKPITLISLGICFFAFILSLIREIVKDIEDMEGDEQFGCRSMPIIKGVPFAKKFTRVLSVLLLASLIYSQYWLIKQNFQLVVIWLVPAVEIPLLLFLFRLNNAFTTNEFHKISRSLKWIMVGGIASMGVIWLNFRF